MNLGAVKAFSVVITAIHVASYYKLPSSIFLRVPRTLTLHLKPHHNCYFSIQIYSYPYQHLALDHF
jgi:hypothetical protein